MAFTYRPLKKIASGGMAEVYLGLAENDAGFKRLVAIKHIRPEFSANPKFLQMFKDEASICQQLTHGNVVQLYEFAKIGADFALVLEYVDGVSLAGLNRSFSHRNTLIPVPLCLFIATEMAKGLFYVHSRKDPLTGQRLGIIHRDISPANILLSSEGEVKIADFGVAKARIKINQTRAGVVKGKYNYMSPEQIHGRSLDHRTDIYSLGIILWEMLAQRRMFHSQSDTELMQMVAKGNPHPELRSFNNEVDGELEAIVSSCLEIDPGRRYPDASQLAHALNQHLYRRYEGFTSIDLAAALKRVMDKELQEGQQLIQDLLTSPSLLRPAAGDGLVTPVGTSRPVARGVASVSHGQPVSQASQPQTAYQLHKGRELVFGDQGADPQPLTPRPSGNPQPLINRSHPSSGPRSMPPVSLKARRIMAQPAPRSSPAGVVLAGVLIGSAIIVCAALFFPELFHYLGIDIKGLLRQVLR